MQPPRTGAGRPTRGGEVALCEPGRVVAVVAGLAPLDITFDMWAVGGARMAA